MSTVFLKLEFHTTAGMFSTPIKGTDIFCEPPYTLYLLVEKSFC